MPVSWIAASFLLSALVTWLSIRYAYHRNLIDQPGQRRLHSVPTPRGGGIGIVVACAMFFVLPLSGIYPGMTGAAAAMLFGLAIVAAIGWWDDHFGLGVVERLAVHVVAASALAFALLGHDGFAAAAVFAFAIVWSINLHNFMDGVDGILGAQALFAFAVLGCFGSHYARPEFALPVWAAAAAVLGFLPFNFPHARVFMGDVGSGVLGLLIAVGVLWQMQVAETASVSGLIACSAFVIDATCNLLSRMLRGKRWYSAHREHLYQWMTRTGMSHARVVGWYAGWNLFVVVPVLYWLNHDAPARLDHQTGTFLTRADLVAVIGIYSVGIALWIFGKRWCLNRVKSHRHA